MNFDIVPTPFFLKEVKILSKKYVSLKSDLKELEKQLLETPDMGEPLGKDCYKIRLQIKSKAKGKSGGGRIITCVKIMDEQIFLLAIYDKSEMKNITNKVLKERLKFIR
ncbi:MAG: type II toxin-antitoxin system RelE/ParE family toxin [Flavobacteriaceae bacterium]|jgi:mRNA-degrading endonuclease RelE of RelBE toxin-antitoxin system|nr:type II toxin-antitoxin system RelE/ParE family toxin [Flavobacteriaceae bacterium]